MFKAGYVGLIGRPNAGKSSLVNALVGEKVAIISSKPQTTRENILGIVNGADFQVVLVDTPGVHHSKNLLNKAMMKNVRSAIAGVDLIVYLIDGGRRPDEEELDYISHLPEPKIVVKTKCDLKNLQNFDCDIEVSAHTGMNLDKLLQIMLDRLPEFDQPHYLFDPEYYTDKSVKFLIAEDIREKALQILHQEVPHGIAVEIVRFFDDENKVYIDVDIICEAERHKGMIIGKGGSVLKEIGSASRQYAQKLLGKKVVLKLFVKVEKNWRERPDKIKSLGY